MPLPEVQKFYQATDPLMPLFSGNIPEDGQYYIDFSSVRGGQIIEDLKETILWSNGKTCQLFTGHIGSGKSTELLRLKKDLEEKEGFQVIYLDAVHELDLRDVAVTDILLAITHFVSKTVEDFGTCLQPGIYFQDLFSWFKDIFMIPVNLTEVKFSVAMAEITAQIRSRNDLRDQMRGYLAPQRTRLLEAINQDILEPGLKKLERQGKKGLVVIVDGLEKLEYSTELSSEGKQEYLFLEQGEDLKGLNCHLVYTMPLELRFSSKFGLLTDKFGREPKVLPMVLFKLRDENKCSEGMELLQQMVLARAFPELDKDSRINQIPQMFDSRETLERLCLISGGHVRQLVRLLNDSIRKEKKWPISSQSLDAVIRQSSHHLKLAVHKDQWDLLRGIAKDKVVEQTEKYQSLIYSRFIFEYYDNDGFWYDVNPILSETKELKV